MIRLWQGRSPVKLIWVFCDGSTGMMDARRGAELGFGDPRGAELGFGDPGRRQLAPHSRCAAAAIARDAQGAILDWAWQELPALSSNEAEYAGLILGLQIAQRLAAQQTICVLDSAVVIGQMEGRFAVNSHDLRRWHWQACAAARTLPAVRYCLVPREWNRLADGLACQASIPWPDLRRAMEERRG